MNAPKFLHRALLLACVAALTPVQGASISGGEETVETTPTPKAGFTSSEDEPVAPTPRQTPKPFTIENSGLVDGGATPTPEASPTPAPDYKVMLKQAQAAFRKKDFDEALELVRKAEALKPDDAEIINFRGAIYAETGRYPEAVALYEKSITINPKSFWAHFNLAEVDFIQKRYPEALAKFESAMQIFPNHELLRFKIILCYLLEKNDDAAKAELDKFVFPANTAAREFANAAWAFAHGNVVDANGWMYSGVQIFGMSRTNFLYDSLADLNWVPRPRVPPTRPEEVESETMKSPAKANSLPAEPEASPEASPAAAD